ncbi:unnamed protein product [Meganyctiphanes norvegica]|uniref:Uncharacterized protein n=1 Tax=Meganyctiphanes norvegica TaxID=48144 RepID=A0AAV2RXZ6_MEGNR
MYRILFLITTVLGVGVVHGIDDHSTWFATVYTGTECTGAYYNVTTFIHDFNNIGFNDLVKSVYGQGAWLLYEEPDYTRREDPVSWTHFFTTAQVDCLTLPVTQHNQLSSMRYVGSGDAHDEILTMYHGKDYTGGEDILIRNDDSLGVFTDHIASIIVTGGASWTIYSENYYNGVGVCLSPFPVWDTDLFFGAWDVAELDMPGLGSVKKGCHSEIVRVYLP